MVGLRTVRLPCKRHPHSDFGEMWLEACPYGALVQALVHLVRRSNLPSASEPPELLLSVSSFLPSSCRCPSIHVKSSPSKSAEASACPSANIRTQENWNA